MVTLAASHMSPEAWAFFSAISVALIGVLGAQLKARSDVKRAIDLSERTKSAADKASQSAQKAEANTANVSNGFASAVLGKLERIEQSQQATEQGFRKHLEWHLENDGRGDKKR